MTSDEEAHPGDHLHTLGHSHPVWAERADLLIELVVPGEDVLEQMVVRSLGRETYEVCCLPFAVYGVALGDVIEVAGLTRRTPGSVVRVVRRSGRCVYRVYLLDEDADMGSAASSFASMGHLVEVYSPQMLAVDASDDEAARLLHSLLDQQVVGPWQYEIGHGPVD